MKSRAEIVGRIQSLGNGEERLAEGRRWRRWADHLAVCSCLMCGGPRRRRGGVRRRKNVLTVQERRAPTE